MKNLIRVFLMSSLLLNTVLASAALNFHCRPYRRDRDRLTSALELYCRGYRCINSGLRLDRVGVKLLNISSLRGFRPEPGLNSEQICQNVSESEF